MNDSSVNWSGRWPLERALFAMAGTVTLISVALSLAISTWFLALTAFVGVSQWLYVQFGSCPASVVLVRGFGFRSRYAEGAGR